MRQMQARKTEFVGLFVEPDLRATIEGEARRRNQKISRLVRTMLREQLAGLNHNSGNRQAAP